MYTYKKGNFNKKIPLSEKSNQKLNRLKANIDGGGGSFDLDEIKVVFSLETDDALSVLEAKLNADRMLAGRLVIYYPFVNFKI
jgi:hypothetical protein